MSAGVWRTDVGLDYNFDSAENIIIADACLVYLYCISIYINVRVEK